MHFKVTQACFPAYELSPACCQICIGVVVDRELRSAYSEEELSLASAFSLQSQCSDITMQHWERHLSGLQGCCNYCNGSGNPYFRVFLLTTADTL